MAFVLADRRKRGHHSPGDGRLQAEKEGQRQDHCYLSHPALPKYQYLGDPGTPSLLAEPGTCQA